MEEKIYENYNLVESVLDSQYKLDEYRAILSRLSDEKSKINFFYRVMYDNTNDAKYMLMLEKNMYMNTRFIDSRDMMMYRLLEFLLFNENYNRKMYLIGFPFPYEYNDYNRWGIPCAWNHKDGGLQVECIFDERGGYVFKTAEKDIEVKNVDDIYIMDISDDMIFIFYNRRYSDIEKYISSKTSASNYFIFDQSMFFARCRQYFDEDFLRFNHREIFFDCGSFRLESTIDFIDVVHGNYDKIYCAEPEEEPYEDSLRVMKEKNLKNVVVENVGVWSSDTVLKMDNSGMGASNISEDGTLEINCKSIDSMLSGAPVSIIKMDIEGSEYDAIVGAKASIERYTPTLMICVYHKPNDVFKLTNLILGINNKYKLYLRHYSYSRYETVLYCIPNKENNN